MVGTPLQHLAMFTRVIGGCSALLVVVGLSSAVGASTDESIAGMEMGLAFAATGGALGLVALVAFALTLHARVISEALQAAPLSVDDGPRALHAVRSDATLNSSAGSGVGAF